MAYSMTGFGRGEKIFDTRKYTVELKSVNNRYCDINIRMPRIFNFADARIRKQITDRLLRGKVDVFINYDDSNSAAETVAINSGLVRAYSDAAAAIASMTGRADDLGTSRLAAYPDVLSVSSSAVDEDKLGDELITAVDCAIDGMIKMRKREGDNLLKDILVKLDRLETLRDEIAARAPMVVELYRSKLSSRMDELLTSEQREFYDDERLAAEVAVFADRCAIDEELKRLVSHFAQGRKILARDGALGKQMDFLVQEINREINTTGSKANDLEITNSVLQMKNTVEEIREQIQNLV